MIHLENTAQVALLLQLLPSVFKEKDFFLKGGTAINFFLRDVPRLSVDIDLVYGKIADRAISLDAIHTGMESISRSIRVQMPGCQIQEKRVGGKIVSLYVKSRNAAVKLEINTILRGHVFPCRVIEASLALRNQFNLEYFATANVMSSPDIYAGKICAALDRQHPRDLFDIKILFENEGITHEIRQAFVVYLACHDRPMAELLAPKLLDMQSVFENEFLGMTNVPVTYAELVDVRARLISEINSNLTDAQRNFLISIKQGEPKWELLGIPGVERLPALQWKLANIRKMGMAKQSEMVSKLKKVLFT